jgi:hypothetical protein
MSRRKQSSRISNGEPTSPVSCVGPQPGTRRLVAERRAQLKSIIADGEDARSLLAELKHRFRHYECQGVDRGAAYQRIHCGIFLEEDTGQCEKCRKIENRMESIAMARWRDEREEFY